jgi:hypothetical protein
MNYADGPSVEVETFIDASPSAVWKLVSDITIPVQFSAELEQVTWLDDTRFMGRSRHVAIGEWETTCTVVGCDTELLFAWVVGDPENPSAQWHFSLEAQGTGTRLRQWMQMGPAPSGLNIAIEAMPEKEERIIARRLDEHRANMQMTVDGIKRLAESG